MRKTKIICTIGPASNNKEMMKKLILAGMNVARFNFSHGTHEGHKKTMDLLKEVREELGKPVAILLDTKGPEIRTGKIKDNIVLKSGENLILTNNECVGDNKKIYINYKNLYKDVKKGNNILIDDGLISLIVEDIVDTDIITSVVVGGEISSNKGVNAPGVKIKLPAFTDRDIEDIKFGIKEKVDFIAASFVRRKKDILKIRRILEDNNAKSIDVIAKIENREGYDNIDSILSVSQGIMVARGDLGVEMPIEEIPIAQKNMIRKCNQQAKVVITATQMLDSMIRNPSPTRAEATDVANAILDGTDAIMLSGETAAGKYPEQAVKIMNKIAINTEKSVNFNALFNNFEDLNYHDSLTYAVSGATVNAAHDLGAKAILTITSSGFTARKLAMHRPSCNIYAMTQTEEVRRKLSIVSGVETFILHPTENLDEIFKEMSMVPVEHGLLNMGDVVVITCGVPFGVIGTTNTMKIHVVGEFIYKGIGIGKTKYEGFVKFITDKFNKTDSGFILYADHLTKSDYDIVKKAGAIITKTGGYSSNAAKWARKLNIPAVIGVDHIDEQIVSGMKLTVDAKISLIHNAITNID